MKPLRWEYLKYKINSPDVVALAKEASISPLVAVVAANRGITASDDLKAFIQKSEEQPHSPFLFKNMDKALQRITYAIENKEKICVYGDYDVDGITATALLSDYLRHRGADCSYYIPERADEGYGINISSIEQLHKTGVKLLISVDTGITAVDEAIFANSLGLDLIVTDHHRCKDTLPDCVAMLNPQLPDCDYPFKNLSGVGVAFKLVCALDGNTAHILQKYGELVALGTIADVVSLTGENRIIVSMGLALISNTKNLGIKALLEVAGLEGKKISVGSIGFGIAPRINAAGRMGSPDVAVRLLLTDNPKEAAELAQRLDDENRTRQKTEFVILQEVLEIIEQNQDYKNKKVIVLGGDGWHHGVIGIVASRVSERYHRPCILISCENGTGKGSGRSIRGFNLFEALKACSHLLEKYGGHELAAGLSLAHCNLVEFDRSINEFAKTNMSLECLSPTLSIDCELPAEYITVKDAKSLLLLEPFGMGNPQPLFSVCGVKICDIRTFSEGKHLRLDAFKDGVRFEVVGFSKGGLIDAFAVGDTVDIAGFLSINEWNGQSKVQLLLKDLVLSNTVDFEHSKKLQALTNGQ